MEETTIEVEFEGINDAWCLQHRDSELAKGNALVQSANAFDEALKNMVRGMEETNQKVEETKRILAGETVKLKG